MLVTYRDGRIKGVKYDQLSAALVNVVKEQQAQIETSKAEHDDLETTVNLLLQRLNALEQVAQTPVAVAE